VKVKDFLDMEQKQMQLNQRATKRALGLIFIIMLMDIIGLTIIFPVAPYLVQRYSHEALMVTLLSVIYAGGQFFAAPALGKISDRVGRRPVLLLCVLGSAVGYFIFGIGGALWVLFLARLIDGITGGNISTASAYIIDVSKPEERARNFTLLGMAYGIGFIVGPALGGVLGQWNLDAPAFVAGAIFLISSTLVFFLLPESLPQERRVRSRLVPNDFNPFASITQMAFRPGLGLVLLVVALFNFSFTGVNSVTGVYMREKFDAPPLTLGLLLVFAGIATAFVQAVLITRLVPRYGEKRMALVGLLAGVICWPLFVAAPALWMLFPISFVQNGITGFIWATTGAMAANLVSEREQGQLAGVNVALTGLTAMLGPLWAGIVYDQVMPGAPYWMGAIILGIACLVLQKVRVKTSEQLLAGAGSTAD
jgi:MFS transporter, DHA1 family, tetracycline resistance protein